MDITSRYLQMLLRSPARRWLSPEVQSDLVLVCEDGRVPCHAALLAPASVLLHQLLAGARPPGAVCTAGGSGPRETMCREATELAAVRSFCGWLSSMQGESGKSHSASRAARLVIVFSNARLRQAWRTSLCSTYARQYARLCCAR